MMRVEQLSAAPDRAGRYHVVLEDGSVLRLYRQTVQDFGIYSGLDLDEDTMKKLRAAAGEMSAKMRAVRIVSASSISKQDLQNRLIQKGERAKDAQAAVQWMADMDLLDDRKTAEQIVLRCINKGYGLARAKQALYEKRIPKELWQEVLADYPQQTEAIADFLRSKLGSQWDQKELKRAVDAAMRRGHSYPEICKALRILQADPDDFPEEW